MGVKSSFLNSNLQEMVYISQPFEFIYVTYPNHVCKLKKSFVQTEARSESLV